MDMNMTMPDSTNSTMTIMTMLPFHTSIGLDMLWFAPWMPVSSAATFGTCVGLFLLGGFYRFLFAVRSTANLNWLMKNENANVRTGSLRSAGKEPSMQDVPNLAGKDYCDALSSQAEQGGIDIPHVPPFSWKRDFVRGLLEGLLSFVGYFLMLAVMTMNAWFFIAIILGIIAGEIVFGRFTARGPLNVHRSC